MWKCWKKCSFHVPYCTSSLLIFLSSHPLLFQNPVLCGTLNSVKPRLPNHTRIPPALSALRSTLEQPCALSCGDFLTPERSQGQSLPVLYALVPRLQNKERGKGS